MADNVVKIHFKPDGDKGLVKAIQALDKETKKLLNTQAKIIDSNKKHTVSQKKGQTQAEKNAIALDKLRVKLTALGFDYKKVVVSNKNFGSALAGSRVALEKVTLATKKYIAENTKADISTRILGGSFAVLRSQLLLFQFAMALGIRQLVKFTQESAKVEVMEKAFNTLSGGTENATKALNQLRQATNNTMSSFDLFQQANNAMILGVAKNSEEMAEMFDIAQRLGNALGRDTAQSVESLVTGIGRQSRLMLDNIGIMVRVGEASENYSRQIGKNASDLTDLEKKQAFTNETMKQARLLAKLLNPEVDDTQKAFQEFGASVSNLSFEIGKALTPTLEFATKLTIGLANALEAKNFTLAFDVIKSLSTGFLAYRTAVFLATIQTKAFTIALLKNPIGLVVASLSTLVFAVLRYDEKLRESSVLTEAQTDKLTKLGQEKFKLQEEIKKLINAQETENDVIERNNKLRDQQINKTNSVTKSLAEELIALKLRKAEILGFTEDEIRRLKVSGDLNKGQKQILDSILKEIKIINDLKNKKQEQEDQEKRFADFKKARRDAERVLFGETEAFKVRELQNTLDKFIELGFTESQIEAFKQSELTKIAKEGIENRKKINKELIDSNKAILNAEKTLFKGNVEFEIKQVEAQAEKFRQIFKNSSLTKEELALKEIAITEFVENQKNEIQAKALKERMDKEIQTANMILQSIQSVTSEIQNFTDQRVQNDLEALRQTERFQGASAESRETMENQVLAKHSKTQFAMFMVNKAVKLADIAMATASGIATVSALPPLFMANPMIAFLKAMGLAQAGIVMATPPPPTFETGGLVGGRRHSQGGTLIEAERGEFVMSRNAVQSLGVETMNQINQGNAGGITLNVSAPLVDETILDTIIPAIQKAQRNNLA
tara:strand:+ start:376 stop:3063 length:2688 start_codon:yes stop_codon:yes gene_type:complete